MLFLTISDSMSWVIVDTYVKGGSAEGLGATPIDTGDRAERMESCPASTPRISSVRTS